MAELGLYLLGPPRVKLDGMYIEVRPRKALALLIYLAVTAEPQARDTLATLLWPESDQRRALRNRLSELKQTIGGDWIDAGRETIVLQPGYWLDAAEFQRLSAGEHAAPERLLEAVDLYRDDFLAGFTLPDCPEYDEWHYFQSESLRRELAAVLDRLVETLSDSGDYETAVPHARRRLALDPLHEPACRRLMRLYALAGQQSAALRQYDLCRQALEEELGVEPQEETTDLYNEIQTESFVRPARPRHNLPAQTTSFIGRETELAEIERLLLDEADCRLLNLAGPGGIGKTRLALAAAAGARDYFPDGAFFVSLAPIGEVDDIVSAITGALRFTFYGSAEPKEQLLDYLSRKELLLVVDNFEHLHDGAGLLSEILTRAPEVTLLATSRERLNLHEEWVYEVRGLPFPSNDGQTSEVFEQASSSESLAKTSEVLSSYSAVELFTRRARQVAANFSPTAAEMGDIVRICRLVEGMPLGLELAAPWIKVLSPREIAAEIARSLDFLTTTIQNVEERHRSLRVVFEQTWQRLSSQEQDVLQKLSVFRGGCTREAAQEVTGATLPVLSSLVDKALVRRTNTGRFELHELIRQFAAVKLVDSGKEAATKQKHLDMFMVLARKGEQAVYGSLQQLVWQNRLEIDHANMRAAIDWGMQHDLLSAAALASAIWVYYFRRGHFHEARKTYDALLERRDQLTDELLAWVLNGRCSVALVHGDIEGMEIFATQALECFQRLGDNFGTGLSYHHLASVSWRRGDFDQTNRFVNLGLAVAGGHHWIETLLLQYRAFMFEARGDLDSAAQIHARMLATSEQFNDTYSGLWRRSNLAIIEIKRKNIAQARELLLGIQADAEKYGEMQITAWIHELIGLVALASGNAEEAVMYIQRKIDIGDSIGGSQDRASELLELGIAQTESFRFTKAKLALLEGSELALKDGRIPVILGLLEHLSRLDWLEQRDPACLRYLSAAAAKRAENGTPLEFPFDTFINQTIGQIRQAISEEHFEALWQDGKNLDPVSLLQEILDKNS